MLTGACSIISIFSNFFANTKAQINATRKPILVLPKNVLKGVGVEQFSRAIN